MALKKTKVLSNGVTADYWKIVDCNVTSNSVCIAPFVDKEHAKNRTYMLSGRTKIEVVFDLKILEQENMNPLKYAYLKIKESKMSELTSETMIEEGREILAKDFVPKELNWFTNAEDV